MFVCLSVCLSARMFAGVSPPRCPKPMYCCRRTLSVFIPVTSIQERAVRAAPFWGGGGHGRCRDTNLRRMACHPGKKTGPLQWPTVAPLSSIAFSCREGHRRGMHDSLDTVADRRGPVLRQVLPLYAGLLVLRDTGIGKSLHEKCYQMSRFF